MPTARHLHIVTGASRGLGLALALRLLDAGHTVLTLARRENAVLPRRAQERGAELTQWQVDLADGAPAAQRLEDWLRTRDGDALESATLINNAGVIPYLAPLRAAPTGAIIHGLRVNLEAPMVLTSAFLRATRGWEGQRRVLNISSGLGRVPMAAQSGYCAAKAGMDLFTRCIVLEEADEANGARVCALAPGVIDTEMQVSLRHADAAQFPGRQRFIELERDHVLQSAEDTARRILDYLDSDDFGREPLADIRKLPAA